MTTNTSLSVKNLPRIAFIQASWHRKIVAQSHLSFKNELESAGIPSQSIDLIEVPGCLEIPLHCQILAKTGNYDVIVAAGLIVDGGIYRHDFVASTVLDGIMRISLDAEIPILSVVLTPHNFNEQPAHEEFFYQHFKTKGKEAAQACIQVLKNMKNLVDKKNIAA